MYLHPLGGVVADLRSYEAETSGARVPRWRNSHEVPQNTRRHLPEPKFDPTTRLSDQWITQGNDGIANRILCSFWIETRTLRTQNDTSQSQNVHEVIGPIRTIQMGWPMSCWPINNKTWSGDGVFEPFRVTVGT